MNIRYSILAFAAAFSVAASAAAKPAAKAKSVEPEIPKIADENPFANYEDAMRSVKDKATAVEWQTANSNEIAKAVAPEAIGAIVDDPRATAELLAKVGDAYKTDPVAATQIAAASQLVMCRKCDKAPVRRVKWTAALVKAAKEADGVYAKMFFLDQLRWCAQVENLKDIREIGTNSGERAVRDFAEMVAREIEAGAR